MDNHLYPNTSSDSDFYGDTGDLPDKSVKNESCETNGRKCVCSICGQGFESENPDVLTLGGFGNPRYLCPDCAQELDRATLSHDPGEIGEAIRAVGETFANNGNDDEVAMNAVNLCLSKAGERKKKIEAGTYDFADDAEDDGFDFDEIPEELREREEDAELDRVEEEAEKKADKIWNMITIAAVAAVIVFAVLRFLVFR